MPTNLVHQAKLKVCMCSKILEMTRQTKSGSGCQVFSFCQICVCLLVVGIGQTYA